MVEQALEETAPLWKPIERAYHWLHKAAHVLMNSEQRSADELERAYGRVLSNVGVRFSVLVTSVVVTS